MASPEPILVHVDDEELNLRVFEATFGKTHRVVLFRAPDEALKFLSQRGQEVAAILTDQRMPGMTGLELLEKARAITPDAQRMLVTAFSDMRGVIEAVNRGQVSRYFVKPWNRDELAAAFDEAARIHQLQTRVRDMEGMLRTSERLTAIGQLSAGLAHELMNPVSYITQNINVLARDLEPLVQYVRSQLKQNPNTQVGDLINDLPLLVEDLQTGTKHLREIAESVKAHARTEPGAGESNLADTATLAIKLAYSAVTTRPRVTVEGPAVRVRGGQVQLCQILVNLIVNAVQAMEEHKKGALIQVRWREEGSYVKLQVSDDGPGIPENIRGKIFEPFFTTKPAGVGTGLGLAICRDLARKLGGDLNLESKEGSGTTLTVTLVKVEDAPATGA